MASSPDEDLQLQRCGPSDALASMFRTCPIDPTEEVQSNLDHLLKRFKEFYRTDDIKLERLQKCCYESKIWYYKILEGLLQENGKRAGFSSFLEDKARQCCLVVCCLEISSYTCKLAFDFDMLLQVLHLTPYSFWKVLILVLQSKVDLTLYVTEHLVKVAEMIVEILAWARDSPLWEEIRVNEGQMPYCQQEMLPKELEDPIKMEQPDLNSLLVFDTTPDQQKTTLNRPQRNKCLYIFARMVYRLMHKRLTTLCSSLNLQEELCMKIWTCFEYSLVHHFDMLQDRQLDWLLLCATHDLTKDIKELPFKHIISCYKRIHTGKRVPTLRGCPEKYQSDYNHRGTLPFPLVHDQEDDAITSFYWQVYTPVMGQFVKKFAPALGSETPPLSPYPTPPPASTSKYRWRPGCNVFVSQLNKETTPQRQPTRMDYVIQSSPSQRLNEINTMVRSHGLCSKRELTFTGGEVDKDEEAGPSAKTPHMSSQSSLLRRLQDVQHDRRQSRTQDKTASSSKHLYI